MESVLENWPLDFTPYVKSVAFALYRGSKLVPDVVVSPGIIMRLAASRKQGRAAII